MIYKVFVLQADMNPIELVDEKTNAVNEPEDSHQDSPQWNDP